jgi:hypothetical protein
MAGPSGGLLQCRPSSKDFKLVIDSIERASDSVAARRHVVTNCRVDQLSGQHASLEAWIRRTKISIGMTRRTRIRRRERLAGASWRLPRGRVRARNRTEDSFRRHRWCLSLASFYVSSSQDLFKLVMMGAQQDMKLHTHSRGHCYVIP